MTVKQFLRNFWSNFKLTEVILNLNDWNFDFVGLLTLKGKSFWFWTLILLDFNFGVLICRLFLCEIHNGKKFIPNWRHCCIVGISLIFILLSFKLPAKFLMSLLDNVAQLGMDFPALSNLINASSLNLAAIFIVHSYNIVFIPRESVLIPLN